MNNDNSYSVIGKNRVALGEERRPGRNLAGVIEKFWFSPRRNNVQGTFEILPDGNFDLVFVLTDSSCTPLFSGPYTQKGTIPISRGKEYCGVTFRPGKMPLLADIPPAEFIDATIALPGLLGMTADYWGEGLLGAGDSTARQAFLEAVFQKSGPGSFVKQDCCSRCAEAVAASKGRIRVQDLAWRAGISMRTLERNFLRYRGISPKKFIRLVRFHAIVTRLRNRGYSTLTQLAYESGYVDQSHFIKDFKALSGILPKDA